MNKWTVVHIEHEAVNHKYSNDLERIPIPSYRIENNYNFYQIRIFADRVNLYHYKDINESEVSNPKAEIEYAQNTIEMFVNIPEIQFDIWHPIDSLRNLPFQQDIRSAYVAQALKLSFNHIISNEKTEYYSITTTGHGSSDNMILQDTLFSKDATALFAHINHLIGKKIDILDMSSNCQMARFEVLQNHEKFFDYIIARDVITCGHGEWSIDSKFDSFSVMTGGLQESFHRLYKDTMKPFDLVKEKLNLHQTAFDTNKDGECSVSAFDSSKFLNFSKTLRAALKENPACIESKDIFTIVKCLNNENLATQFNDLRFLYAHNKNSVHWESESNGLSVSGAHEILTSHGGDL